MKKVLLVMTMGLGISSATLPFSFGDTWGTCRDGVTNGIFKAFDSMARPLDYVHRRCEARTTQNSIDRKYSALNTALIYAFIAKDSKSFFDRFEKAISQKASMFGFEYRSLVAEVTMKALLYSMARPGKCVSGVNKQDWFKTVAYIALAQLIDADVYKKVEDSVKAACGKGCDAYGFVHDKIVK